MTSATTDAPTIATAWPEGFAATKPGVGGFAVREVAAPADAVFAWIRRIDLHPQFYPALRAVRRLGGAWPAVDEGSALSFLVGATYVPYLKVQKVDTEQRSLAWGGGVPGLSICHGWTVKEIGEGRSLVRSEELWVGPVAVATGALTKPQIQKVQTQWVEAVARAAKAHPAGPPAA